MSNFLKQAYHHGQQHALAEFGLLGRTKTANRQKVLEDYAMAGLLGSGVGAAIDDDSALQGALIGAAGGVGAHGLGRHLHKALEDYTRGKVVVKGMPSGGHMPLEIRALGSTLTGVPGGLGAVGVSNMIDDGDESVLARLGLA